MEVPELANASKAQAQGAAITSKPIPPEPIAIVGIGCRFPGSANSAKAFWELLRDGRDAITEVPAERWDLQRHFDPDPLRPLHQHVRHGGFVDDIDAFDPAFFGITPREAVCMDPQQRLLMEVAWQAIEDAGQPLESIRGQQVGVFMGISSSDYSALLWTSEENYAIPDNEPFVLPGNTGCIAANRLSYFFDFKGPSFTVDTACSSSLVAVHLACESLWRGESEAALAGGVQALIHPGIQMSFCKAGLLAPDGRCKSFDAAANGYARSEGAGAVLLKPLTAAQADGDAIYALIHGTAMNSDGRSNGMVAPNLRAQIACVRAAFARAGLDPATTQYVEAHGTGTRQGDPIELRALGKVLGEGREPERPCRVGSVKTNLGHSETAAGITGLIKAALCVHHRQLPASLHFRTPNPAIDFAGLKLKVQTSLEPFPDPSAPAVVGVSSFGFGGTNAHVVLAEAPETLPQRRFGAVAPLQLLTLSARSEAALSAQMEQLYNHLQAEPRLGLSNVCATANQLRSQLGRRLVCVAASREELLAQLGGATTTGVLRGQASQNPGKVCFLFSGQGCQLVGMAQALHTQHPVFREAFERCTSVLDALLPRPLEEVLFPAPGQEEAAKALLDQTSFCQPALFTVEYAMAQLWLSWGVEPDLLLGHSVGEIVAAHLADVFSLADALKLVAARGRLMQALPAGGGMLAVLAGEAKVRPLLGCELAVAALNGPANTVVSGPLVAIDDLQCRLLERGIKANRLAVSHAFHSPAMAAMLADFEAELAPLSFAPPRRTLISNLSGQVAGSEVASSHYWCDHVMAPVRFAEGMAAAVAQGAGVFVEMGPRPTLIGMGRQCLSDPSLLWCPSLKPGQSDWEVLLQAVAQLHLRGVVIHWRQFHRPFPNQRVALPGYPFQRQRFWWSPSGDDETPASLWLQQIKGSGGLAEATGPGASCLEPMALPGGRDRRFRIWLSADDPADLSDHQIREQVVFPAAGFIELGLLAYQQLGLPLQLGRLELDQPLKLAGERCELQLVLGEGLEWHSHGGTSQWRGHGHWQPSQIAAQRFCNWQEPPATAEALDLGTFYAALARFGLCYGPRFRSLERVVRQGDRAWGWLRRVEAAADWTLLDGCFQVVAATLDPESAAGQILLPVGLDQLELARLPLPDCLRCQVILRASQEPAFVLADLELFDAEGLTLGWLEGFRLRRMPRQALDWLFPLAQDQLEAPQPNHQRLLVQSCWQTLPEKAPAPEPEGLLLLWPGVAADGKADGLEAALTELLNTAQHHPSERPIWLVIEGDGPLQGALDGFARTAALERPRQQWLRIYVPLGLKRVQLPLGTIAAWAQQESALRLALETEEGNGPLQAQRFGPLPPARFRLGIGQFGVLESLAPEAANAQPLAAGELELAVEATGLNFRDVLNALGVLRSFSRQLGLDEATRLPFGGECVGRVMAVGEGVDPALVGQRLLAALAVGSLASHVVCRAELCVPWPEELPGALGASLSTAFLTAIYGLQTLAKLQPGETVLIHAGAGGVGQAAIQVAQRCGARVFTTASASKQPALRAQGVDGLFDSRSLDFVAQVRQATGGRGADVVLNSLKGDWVEASFAALAEGGRFVELGKVEIWSREQAAERRPDATYLPFDLLEVAAADAAMVRQLLEQFLEAFRAGLYQPLPLKSWPMGQVEEAFRLMAQGRHVGKLVIEQSTDRQPKDWSCDQSLLVSGGFGGIGLQLLPWLAQRGVSELVVVSRSADRPGAEAQKVLEQLAAAGVRVLPVAVDLGSADPAEQAAGRDRLVQALRQAKPLAGVFHAAGVLDDGLLDGQTAGRLAVVLAPKWRGWQLLKGVLTEAGQSPWVVHFSSLAALLGSPGQSGYGAANGALDGLARSQERQLAVQWGPWQGAGMASQLDELQQQRLSALGLRSLEVSEALVALGDLLGRGQQGVVAVVDADWPRLARQGSPSQAAAMARLVAAAASDVSNDVLMPAYVAVLERTPPAERPLLLQAFVREQLAKVMGLADEDQIDPGEPLFNMGLDSLMALELMVLLEQNLGIRLNETLVFDHPTIEALVRHFLAVLFPDSSAGSISGSSGLLESPEEGAQEEIQHEAWSEQVASVAAMDPAALLEHLRSTS